MRCTRLGLAIVLAAFAGKGAAADQVVADDLIVQGSECVGLDCVNNESFGFDTLRMKGPVLRFQFTDTSTSAGFPTTDWQITVNDDDAVGTLDFFSIEDLDAGTVPFTLEGGAPSDSIHVTSDGRVGLGTAAPTPMIALDVLGSVKADEAIDVTGTVKSGAKAGVVPASAFLAGQASVTFAVPYAGDYSVLLTALSDKPSRRFKPAVLVQDANGFTLTAGKKNVKHLVEIQWIAQPVGE
jgi:hypothetical protein